MREREVKKGDEMRGTGRRGEVFSQHHHNCHHLRYYHQTQ